LKNNLHILKSELPEDGKQLRPKDVGGLTNKSFVQQVGVKFYICLTKVYVIRDNINAFNNTLNNPSKADSAAMLNLHYALLSIQTPSSAPCFRTLQKLLDTNFPKCEQPCVTAIYTTRQLYAVL